MDGEKVNESFRESSRESIREFFFFLHHLFPIHPNSQYINYGKITGTVVNAH